LSRLRENEELSVKIMTVKEGVYIPDCGEEHETMNCMK
jgi:hypothetical protein